MFQKILLVILLFGTGLCLNIIPAPAMAEISYVIEAKEKKEPGIFGSSGAYAKAYGISCLAFAAGGLVGSLWAGMIIDRSGWGTLTWTLGLLSAVTATPAVVWMGGRLQMERRETGDVETRL
jgi:MFS family permease